MSRIGKQPIKIPDGVNASIEDGLILVKGPKGQLAQVAHKDIVAEVLGGNIIIKKKDDNSSNAIWGLMRALAANMVQGVTEGFAKRLEIQGVGYKAQLSGNKIVLNLGFSHQVELDIPSDISVTIEGNFINISGIDKYKVGQMAADIRALKKPEPYKGKGIRYEGEHVRRKAGKKAAT